MSTADDDRRQLRPDDLARMSPAEIAEAYRTGRCRELMTGRPVMVVPATGQIGAADLANMSPAEIAEAYHAGRLRDAMTTPPAPPPPAAA